MAAAEKPPVLEIDSWFGALLWQNEQLRNINLSLPVDERKRRISIVSRETANLLEGTGILSQGEKTGIQRKITSRIKKAARQTFPGGVGWHSVYGPTAMRLSHYLATRKVVGDYFHQAGRVTGDQRRQWQEKFNWLGSQVFYQELAALLDSPNLVAEDLARGLEIDGCFLSSIINSGGEDDYVVWAREKLSSLSKLMNTELPQYFAQLLPTYFQEFLTSNRYSIVTLFDPSNIKFL